MQHLSSSYCAASPDIPEPLSPLPPSFIASGRSSGLHPVSSHSCCMNVRAGRPAFGVHRSTSLMRSSLLLQQCPACLVRQTWIVFVMGSRWLYSWCFVGRYLQCAIGPMCCVLKKEVHRKRNTQTRKYSSRLLFT